MSSGQAHRLGGNLVLASCLALLSYVPFELVAKGSLIVCALLFVVDPIPPLSRLLSLISLLVILGLTKAYRQHQIQQQQEEAGIEGDVTVVQKSEDEQVTHYKKKEQ